LRDIEKEIMNFALKLAQSSSSKNEIPVGCVIADLNGNIISYAYNSTFKKNDPTAHAEIIAIRRACKKLRTRKLLNFSLFVTLEPCKMCEAAILQSGIKRVFFGAYSNYFRIFTEKKKNYSCEDKGYQYYGGIQEEKCSNLIKDFFKNKR